MMPKDNTRREFIAGTGASIATVSLAGCAGVFGEDAVSVSSKDFTEQFILAHISRTLLDENGYETTDNTGLGGTTGNLEALRSGDVDLYWEYTGTAWIHILEQEPIDDPDELYEQTAEMYLDEYDIEWLDPAPLNNTYVMVTTPEWSSETGVDDLDDLAEYISDGNTDFTIAMEPEIEERDDGWGGLPATYDFEESAADVGTTNMQLGLAVQAVAEEEVEVGFAFATDAPIEEYGLNVLDDTRNHFVVYNPAPNVRSEIVDDELREILNEPTQDLDSEMMRILNGRVSIDGEDPQDVARDFLEENGYI